jgi:hypothetical protein
MHPINQITSKVLDDSSPLQQKRPGKPGRLQEFTACVTVS